MNQVFPHQVLCEGKGRKHNIRHNLPSPDVLDRFRDAIPDPFYIESSIVFRQVPFGNTDVELKVLMQHLDERRIELWLVFVQGERKPGTYASPIQCNRNENQRSPVSLLLRFLCPDEKANCEEQRVSAALFERRAGSSIQLDQRGLEFLFSDLGEDVTLSETFERVLSPDILVCSPFVKSPASRVGAVHQIGPR